MDAFELRDGNPAGYQFQVIAEPEEDLLALLGRLIEKMRRALVVKHIDDSERGLQITKAKVVRGLIDWDSEQGGSTPHNRGLRGLSVQIGNPRQERGSLTFREKLSSKP